MNFHIIIDHPWKESFNFAILDSVIKAIKEKNEEFDVLDLNRENFNPVMNEKELALYAKGKYLDPKVKEYQNRLSAADYLIFIFPITSSALYPSVSSAPLFQSILSPFISDAMIALGELWIILFIKS